MKVAVVGLVTAMVPNMALPPAMPFTSQIICAVCAAHNEAVKDCVWPRATLADDGEMEFVLAQVMVTVAVADLVGSAVLVAAMVTVGGEGIVDGAV